MVDKLGKEGVSGRDIAVLRAALVAVHQAAGATYDRCLLLVRPYTVEAGKELAKVGRCGMSAPIFELASNTIQADRCKRKNTSQTMR